MSSVSMDSECFSEPTDESKLSEVRVFQIPRKPSNKTGYCLIIHNAEFPEKELNRPGSEKDLEALKQTFLETYNLEGKIVDNGDFIAIEKSISEISCMDFNDYSCLVVVVLSHGSENETVYARDGSYSLQLDVVLPVLTNSTLIGKPKIFIVQACKGSMYVSKGNLQADGVLGEVLKCYSTMEGFVSYRDTRHGSVYIQALCKKMIELGKTHDIEAIMKEVRIKVAEETKQAQMPCVTSTFTKSYIFGDHL